MLTNIILKRGFCMKNILHNSKTTWHIDISTIMFFGYSGKKLNHLTTYDLRPSGSSFIKYHIITFDLFLLSSLWSCWFLLLMKEGESMRSKHENHFFCMQLVSWGCTQFLGSEILYYSVYPYMSLWMSACMSKSQSNSFNWYLGPTRG